MGYQNIPYSPVDGFAGHGDVRFYPFDASGEPTLGGIDLGFVGKLAIDPPEIDKIEMKSYRDPANPGQVVDEVIKSKKFAISITTKSINKETVNLLLFGTSQPQSQAAGSVTDESVTGRTGRWVDLEHRNLAAGSVVVTNSDGSVTYTEDTDYQVDYWGGAIKVLTGGAISDGDTLLVDYNYQALNYDEISGSQVSKMEGKLTFKGQNFTTGQDVELIIPRLTLEPSGGFDEIAEDYTGLEFKGSILVKGNMAPIYKRLYS